jgi:hypothetical protein
MLAASLVRNTKGEAPRHRTMTMRIAHRAIVAIILQSHLSTGRWQEMGLDPGGLADRIICSFQFCIAMKQESEMTPVSCSELCFERGAPLLEN